VLFINRAMDRVIVLVLACTMSAAIASQVSCLSDNGVAVSYWIGLKKNAGYNYLYADSSRTTFAASSHTMDSKTSGALAYTSIQMWDQSLEYLAFNDDVPEGVESEGIYSNSTDPDASISGHTKGYLAWSTNAGAGFWLTHSVPRFPLTPAQVSSFQGLGSNANTYAQHVYCVTLTMAEVETLAKALAYNQPDVFSSSVSTTTRNKYPAIKALVEGSFPTSASCVNFQVAGVTVFAKTGEWGKDLWDDCVAPFYQANILVETWLRGYEIGPACPPAFKYETLDIDYLSFTSTYQWKETQDHSKWAVGNTDDVICFGDINRMTSQYKRGGGATCFYNSKVWQQMRNAITEHNSC
jgi:deoxyribonuclease II